MLRPGKLRQYGALFSSNTHSLLSSLATHSNTSMFASLLSSRMFHSSNMTQRIVRSGRLSSALESRCSSSFKPLAVAPQTLWVRHTTTDSQSKREELGGDAFKLEKDTWAERHAPQWMIPYIQLARLNRPAGTYMLLWPCFWSISLAAPAGQLPDLGMLALFGTGALIMRSAGCTINDMWDKDFDKQVERTNQRPLASGALTYEQAWKFLAVQLTAGLGVLLQLNWYSIALGASSMALVISYPLMKRVTYWPQAVLGLTFNYGALLGWSAIQGTCAWPVVLPLYAGGIAWTLVYDTLYAHQDKKDDQHIGVRSTALLFGDNTQPILNVFSATAIAGFGTAGYMVGLDWPFYVGLAGGAAHLAWQVNTAKLDDPINLQMRFASNKWFGALMFASIVAGKVF